MKKPACCLLCLDFWRQRLATLKSRLVPAHENDEEVLEEAEVASDDENSSEEEAAPRVMRVAKRKTMPPTLATHCVPSMSLYSNLCSLAPTALAGLWISCDPANCQEQRKLHTKFQHHQGRIQGNDSKAGRGDLQLICDYRKPLVRE